MPSFRVTVKEVYDVFGIVEADNCNDAIVKFRQKIVDEEADEFIDALDMELDPDHTAELRHHDTAELFDV